MFSSVIISFENEGLIIASFMAYFLLLTVSDNAEGCNSLQKSDFRLVADSNDDV